MKGLLSIVLTSYRLFPCHTAINIAIVKANAGNGIKTIKRINFRAKKRDFIF
jgi:hypothetical protein